MPVSDLRQEAADYVELQMDGGGGAGVRSLRGAKGPRQLMPQRAAFRLATPRWSARHLRAQGVAWRWDAIPSCQPGFFTVIIRFPVLTWSTRDLCPSFEPHRDRAVLKRHTIRTLPIRKYLIFCV